MITKNEAQTAYQKLRAAVGLLNEAEACARAAGLGVELRQIVRHTFQLNCLALQVLREANRTE